MAKKKRRLARRPRPETRKAADSSQETSTSEDALPQNEEVSDEAEVSGGEDSEVADGENSAASDGEDVADGESADAAQGEDTADDTPAARDDADVEEAVHHAESAELVGEDENSELVADPELPEQIVASDGDDVADDSETTEEDVDEPYDVERSFEDFVRSDDEDDEVSADSGHGLIGEGVEIDEAEVEDTEHFLKGLVEAILFSSDKPQDAKEVARAARIDKRRAQELIELLIDDTRNRGVRLVEVSEGYAYRTNPAYSSYVREFLSQRPVRLSRAQLETLAIIAYRQPLTRPEVDDIRGVDTGAVIKLLLERDLIRILGKKDEPGRPMIYGTTPQFLDLFSLTSLRDLPTLREFTELSDDSRAKFEMEIGEPAPEGVIEFPEAENLEDVSDLGSHEASSDAVPDDGDDNLVEGAELDFSMQSDDEEDLAVDDEGEKEFSAEASTSDQGEDHSLDDSESEVGFDDSEEESEDDGYRVPEVSAADEEEFPDDDDDDDDDEDDDDDDDDDE